MTTDRRSAIIIGVLFFLATVSAIVAMPLYDSIVNHQNYLGEGARHTRQVVPGALSVLNLLVLIPTVWLTAKWLNASASALARQYKGTATRSTWMASPA